MTKKISRVSGHVVLILLSFLALFPIYWMIISSLKGNSEIFGYSMITTQPSFSNYIDAFTTVPLFRMMVNSIVVSLGTALLQLVVAVLFAYAFTRWNFKGKTVVYGILSITWLLSLIHISEPTRH